MIHYLATIKRHYDSESKTFDTIADAEQWLDENNNNHENVTFIDEYDNNWWKVGGFIYTEGTK